MTILDMMVRKGTPYRLQGTFGVDITGATITVHYVPPSPGVAGTWTGAIEDAAAGDFYCDVTALQNNAAGDWAVYADAIVGGVTIAGTFAARVVSALETTVVSIP